MNAFRHYQQMLVECDREMARYTQDFDGRIDGEQNPLPPEPHPHRPRKNEFRCAMREELYRLFGVDLTALPGINTLTGFTVFSELGTEVSKFPSSPAFTAWTSSSAARLSASGVRATLLTVLAINWVAKVC